MNLQLQETWDLTKEFYRGLDDPKISEDYQRAEDLTKNIRERFEGNITSLDAQACKELLTLQDELSFYLSRLGIFYLLLSSKHGEDLEVQKAEQHFNQFTTKLGNELLFIDDEMKQLGKAGLEHLSEDPKLAAYRGYLLKKARTLQYQLDQHTEYVLNLKDLSGSSAFTDLYDRLNASFVFRPVIDGETKELTDPEVRTLRRHPDPAKRKEALRAMREVFSDKEHLITFSSAYLSIVKDWTTDVEVRGFQSVMSPRNVSEDLDDDVVNRLIEEVTASYPLYQRYLQSKATMLGKTTLDHWDLHATLAKEERDVPFQEATDMILNTYQAFDETFHQYAKEMLTNGQVDVYPQKGKRGGAFAVFEQGFNSYVMLNHTNRLDDVNTLIHEFGHAIHGYLLQDLPGAVYTPPLCLAETASIFSELLLGAQLQEKLSAEEQLTYLSSMIEEAFGAIHRQTQYICFERRVHELVHQGETLSHEDLCRLWREEQVKMTGSMVTYDCPPEQESSWASIPHIFHTPFYCYTYAFGNLLSFSLYRHYQQEGDAFKEKYLDILKAGGSVSPRALLERNGIDITQSAFFREGLKVLEDMVEQFERLVQQHQ